ncbi:hypothetical protein GGI35DRAFT_434036 [Trichoderma velutinum]
MDSSRSLRRSAPQFAYVDDITEVSHYLATTVSKQEFHVAILEVEELSYKNPAKMAVGIALVELAVMGNISKERAPYSCITSSGFATGTLSRCMTRFMPFSGFIKPLWSLRLLRLILPYFHTTREMCPGHSLASQSIYWSIVLISCLLHTTRAKTSRASLHCLVAFLTGVSKVP